MMTIKICRNDGSGMTHLHEGNNVRYQYIEFIDKSDFQKKFDYYIDDGKGEYHFDMLYPETEYRNEKEKTDPIEGHFLLLVYNALSGSVELCFARCAKVFIMHDGKTIDTIYC